jgi:hypothetical protein
LRNVAFDAKKPILQRFLAGDVAELTQLGSARRQIGHGHADIASHQGKRHGAPEPARTTGDDDGLVCRI